MATRTALPYKFEGRDTRGVTVKEGDRVTIFGGPRKGTVTSVFKHASFARVLWDAEEKTERIANLTTEKGTGMRRYTIDITVEVDACSDEDAYNYINDRAPLLLAHDTQDTQVLSVSDPTRESGV